MEKKQTPLFLPQIIALLQANKVEKIIDATFGLGGHGLNLAKLGYEVLALEWDPVMFAKAQKKIMQTKEKPNLFLVNDNFKNLKQIAKVNNFFPQAIIFDLGLSMEQLAFGKRGFSIYDQEELDLRINPDLLTTAKDYLNQLNREQLTDFCLKYLESRYAFQVAHNLLAAKKQNRINSVSNLKEAIDKLSVNSKEKEKLLRLLLQGLRIVVNQEAENLNIALGESVKLLKKGGLIIIITFQSFEDRQVKLFFKNNPFFLEVYRPPLKQKDFSFARSAKLRAYVKNSL